MSDKPTAFELECLRRLERSGAGTSGNGRIAFIAALRRLEKKGLAVKGRRWCLTTAGRRAIADADAVEQQGEVQPPEDTEAALWDEMTRFGAAMETDEGNPGAAAAERPWNQHR